MRGAQVLRVYKSLYGGRGKQEEKARNDKTLKGSRNSLLNNGDVLELPPGDSIARGRVDAQVGVILKEVVLDLGVGRLSRTQVSLDEGMVTCL